LVAITDANRARRCHLAPVDERGTERVVLELEAGEPISGRIHRSTGPAQMFRGWLELASTLEQLRPAHSIDHTAADEKPEGRR
jgi:hypothetical protein